MFVDARTLPDGAAIDADLCIVGAGPAAIAIARELAGLGIRIVLIESGGIKPEIRRKYLDRGSSVGYQYYNLMFTRARAFGGTSSRWHMHVHGDEGWMARPFEPDRLRGAAGHPVDRLAVRRRGARAVLRPGAPGVRPRPGDLGHRGLRAARDGAPAARREAPSRRPSSSAG